jgi:hypothetical protein
VSCSFFSYTVRTNNKSQNSGIWSSSQCATVGGGYLPFSTYHGRLITGPQDTPEFGPGTLIDILPSSSHVGAIVGGTIGGVAGIIVAAGLALFIWQRRKRRLEKSALGDSQAPIFEAQSPGSDNGTYVQPSMAGTSPPTMKLYVRVSMSPPRHVYIHSPIPFFYPPMCRTRATRARSPCSREHRTRQTATSKYPY